MKATSSPEQTENQSNIKTVKQKITEFAIQELSKEKSEKPDIIKSHSIKKEILSEYLEEPTVENLAKLANSYKVLLDAYRGISTTESKTDIPFLTSYQKTTGETLIVRDCRNQGKEESQIRAPQGYKESWHHANLGTLSGAISMVNAATNLNDKEKKAVNSALAKNWENYQKKIDTLDQNDQKKFKKDAFKLSKEFNGNICQMLENCEIKIPGKQNPIKGLDKIGELIGEYRDFNNLKEEPKSVMTIAKSVDIKKPDGTVIDTAFNVLVEVRVDSLSKKHRDEYEQIKKVADLQKIQAYIDFEKNSKNQTKGVIEEYKKLPHWFKNMKAEHQNTYKQNIDEILKDESARIPKWFKKLPQHRQELVKGNIDSILSGNLISSQIMDIPALRNAYVQEKITILQSELKGKTEGQIQELIKTKVKESELSISSATPAHIKGDEQTQLEISKENVSHINNLTGKDYKTEVLCLNQNLGSQGTIVKNLKYASKENDVEFTNIPASVNHYGSQSIGKIKRANDITNTFEEAAKNQAEIRGGEKATMVVVSCKSGKDRAGTFSRIVAWVSSTTSKIKAKFKNTNIIINEKKLDTDIQQSIINSGHCEEMSSRGGGALGMKSGTILSGMGTRIIDTIKHWFGGPKPQNQHYLADYADNLKGPIANLNKIQDNISKSKNIGNTKGKDYVAALEGAYNQKVDSIKQNPKNTRLNETGVEEEKLLQTIQKTKAIQRTMSKNNNSLPPPINSNSQIKKFQNNKKGSIEAGF